MKRLHRTAQCSFLHFRKASLQDASFKKRLTELTWYSCGPTVYDQAHIGHARTYVCTDIIRRILEDHFNVSVNFALGITDIDDKIIIKGRELGHKEWKDTIPMIRELENNFFKDMDALNVKRPNAILRVTDHIPQIIDFIDHLVIHDYAYITTNGVYFDVNKLGDKYGKLCAIPPSSSLEPDNNETSIKRNWRDFVLWKANKPDEPSWPSPWGAGRPGWHIECSAMTQAYFGNKIDIHSGGVDLQFPHHTNEIAQRLVKYYVCVLVCMYLLVYNMSK